MLISNAIESYLTSSYSKEDVDKEHKFYLSDMGKCMRMRYFKRLGVQIEFPPHVTWVLRMGDLIHDFGYKALEAQGLLLEAEDYVSNEHFIGRYDGIVKDGREKVMFDFKSVSGFAFDKMMKGEDSEENIAQLLSYVMLLREKRKDVSEKALIIYLNKEPGDRRPFISFEREYHLTNWRAKQLKEEMNVLVALWQADKMPACSCPAWMKAYNVFQPLCQMREVDAKKIVKQIKDGKKFVSIKNALYLKDGEERRVVIKI
jgi:hypothetical protein